MELRSRGSSGHLRRLRGREIDTAGDEFLAAFDGLVGSATIAPI
jgi:hypothetical protein